MAQNHYARRVESQEDLAAQLSAAREAQRRQLLKLRSATDRNLYRLAALTRSPEAMTALEQHAELLLDIWDEVAHQMQALEAAHCYIREQRSKRRKKEE